MSVVQHSHHAIYLPPAVSLPREHLAAIQHIINDALRGAPAPPPPPPYNPRAAAGQWYRPRMDMYEASGAVTATFELPGLRKEDIHIDVVDGRMVVVGERGGHTPANSKDERHDEDMPDAAAGAEMRWEDSPAGYTVREIKRGRFRRIVALPAGIKLEDIKAVMHDGILTVTFPGAPRPAVRSVPIE